MSTTELEDRIRASLRTWAAEVDDADADDGRTAKFEPGRSTPVRLVALQPEDEPDTDGAATPTTARSRMTLLLVSVAAVLVIAVVVAFGAARTPDGSVDVIDDPAPADPGPAPEPTPGPRAVATVLPDGFGPIWRGETAPIDPATVIGGGSRTIQRFDTEAGSITLLIRPGLSGVVQVDPSSNATVRKQPATIGSGNGSSQFNWNEGDANITAFAEGSEAAATMVLDSLLPRTTNPADGFDPPAGGSAGVTLRAEQIWPEGSGDPTTSTVAYAASGSSRWSVVVSSVAAWGEPNLDLVTSEVGSERKVVAGEERVVVTAERQVQQVVSSPAPGPDVADFFDVVAWYDPDGALIVVRARDVDDQTLEAIVAGVDRADDATWAELSAGISTQVDAMPVATSSTWGDVELTMRGDAPPADIAIYGWKPAGACLRTGDGVTRCAADPYGGGAGGPTMLAPYGYVPMAIFEAGQHLVSASTPDGWWLFGAIEGTPDEVVVTAPGVDVDEQWTSTIDGRVTVVAAFVPGTAPRATVTVAATTTPVGTEVPATGLPQRDVRDIVIDAPAP